MRVWFNRTFSSVHAAIGLIRQADAAGRFHITYSNPNPHVAAARVAHAFYTEPTGLTSDAYIDWCLAFCREQQIAVFIPGKGATALASQHARFAAHGVRILSAAPSEQLALIHDKARFYAVTDLPAAPVAPFRPFETLAQFDAAWEALRPHHRQLCVKPSNSVFGLGFAILDEERSSAALLLAGAEYRIGLPDFRRGLAELPSFRTMLLMTYLDGEEFSVDCAGDHGKLMCAVARRKPATAGQGQIIDMRADIVDACAALAATHALNGVFNIQFRLHDGALHLLEINPRMSGGIGMACVAGPNLPYIALCGFADGYDAVVIPPVRDGIRVAELALATELA